VPSKLASLVVDMELNSAALRSGLDELNTKLDGFGKKLDSLAQVVTFEKIGGLAKEAATKLADFVLKGAEVADQMGKIAQSAGQGVEAFSRLAYGANLSGVSTEDLGQAFNKLNKNLSEAAAGSSKQAALFSALGVSIKDSNGHVRDSGAVMSDLATKFAKYQDGASKSAVAMEIFGKAGTALIPFLNQGGEGLAKLSAEADRFGITISTSAAASAEEFNDNLQRLEIASQRVGTRVAAELAPALSKLTGELLDSKAGADALRGASEFLANVMKVLVSGGVILSAVFEAVGTTLGRVASAVVNAAKGQFTEAGKDLKSFVLMDDIITAGKTGADRIGAVWTTSSDAVEQHGKVVKKSMDGIAKSILDAPKALADYEAAFKSLTKVALDYESKVAGFGQGPLEQLEAKLDKGELSEQLKKLGKDAGAMRDRILEAAKALQDLEATKLTRKVEFETERATAGINSTESLRTSAYQRAGSSQSDTNEFNKGAFKSFEDALGTWSAETIHYSQLIGSAEELRAAGDEKAANATLLFADEVRRTADAASKAADAFHASAEALHSSLSAAGSKLASKMGEVGTVISAGVEGFKSGGIWGAIVGVIGEIITKLSGFTRIVESMNAFFGRALANIDKAFGPIFDIIIQFAEIVGEMIESITSLSGAFEMIRGVLWVLGKVIDTVELSFLYVAKGIADLFGGNAGLNAMVKKVEDDLKKPFDAPAKNLADGLNKAADAAVKVADKFNEMLTNIPTGYKVNGRRFGADNGGSPGAGGGGSTWTDLQGLSDSIASTTDSKIVSQWNASMGDVLKGVDYSTTFTPSGTLNTANGPGQGTFTGGENAQSNAGNSSQIVGGLTPDELSTWLTAWTSQIMNGASPEQAVAAADAYILSRRGGTSSSSSAATAASGGGGGNSGIHSVGGGSAAATTESGGGGDVHFHGPVTLLPRDFSSFVKDLTEVQESQGGTRRRNPYRGKT
jgi:hypothetical protein